MWTCHIFFYQLLLLRVSRCKILGQDRLLVYELINFHSPSQLSSIAQSPSLIAPVILWVLHNVPLPLIPYTLVSNGRLGSVKDEHVYYLSCQLAKKPELSILQQWFKLNFPVLLKFYVPIMPWNLGKHLFCSFFAWMEPSLTATSCVLAHLNKMVLLSASIGTFFTLFMLSSYPPLVLNSFGENLLNRASSQIIIGNQAPYTTHLLMERN